MEDGTTRAVSYPYDTTKPEEIERNFRLGVINGIIYIFAESFLDPTLVLVAFISHLTNSPFLLGLVVPLRDGSWALPQFWVANYLQRLPRKITLYRLMVFIRIGSFAVISASILFIQNTTYLLIAFFITFTISSIASGIGGLPFLEIVSKTIPANRRGEFFAWRFGVGGLLGIGSSLIVRWLISPNGPLPFPENFALLSFLFFIFATIGLLIYLDVHEMPDVVFPPKRNTNQQMRIVVDEFRRNVNFQRTIVAQSLLMFAGSATPFFAVYVQQQLGGTTEWVGIYLGVMMAFNLISNLVFGRLSRRVDNQRVLFLAALAGMIMSGLVLFLPLISKVVYISPLLASIWLLPVFAINGIRGTGIGISANSLLLNIAPPTERSLIIGFTQSFLGVILLLTGLNGMLLGWLGFPVLVALTLGAHLLAVLQITKISDSPVIA